MYNRGEPKDWNEEDKYWPNLVDQEGKIVPKMYFNFEVLFGLQFDLSLERLSVQKKDLIDAQSHYD